MEEGSIKTKEKVISMSLSCPGYIELEKEDIFVPTSFYELIYNNFLGFFIIGKNCEFENNDFICNCEELNKINSFETILMLYIKVIKKQKIWTLKYMLLLSMFFV